MGSNVFFVGTSLIEFCLERLLLFFQEQYETFFLISVLNGVCGVCVCEREIYFAACQFNINPVFGDSSVSL